MDSALGHWLDGIGIQLAYPADHGGWRDAVGLHEPAYSTDRRSSPAPGDFLSQRREWQAFKPSFSRRRHPSRRRGSPRARWPRPRSRRLALVDADPVARRRDLPDLCRFMLATGMRIGGVLAVTWADVDLDAATVTVDHTVLRLKGQGLVLSRLKSPSSYRTLVLPEWGVEMLRARRQRCR